MSATNDVTERQTDAEYRLMKKARADDELRADDDGGMRVAAYVVLSAAFVVGGVLFVAVLRLLGGG